MPVRVGKAVVRNRIKRRLREAFRLQRPLLAPGWDIVLNPRERVAQVSFQALEKELLRLFPSQPPQTRSEESTPR